MTRLCYVLFSSIFQVHLTLETGVAGGIMDTEVPRARPTAPVSQLVRLLWGEDTTELQMNVAHIPHIVMYLSLKLDSESPQEEVSGSVEFSRLWTLSETIRKQMKCDLILWGIKRASQWKVHLFGDICAFVFLLANWFQHCLERKKKSINTEWI